MVTHGRLGLLAGAVRCGLFGLSIFPLAGCGGANVLLSDVVGELVDTTGRQTLLIKVINDLGLTSETGLGQPAEVDLRIDGLLTTVRCEAGAAMSKVVLAECPLMVQVVHDRVYGPDDEVLRERNYEGVDGFVLTREHFDCGAVLMLWVREDRIYWGIVPPPS